MAYKEGAESAKRYRSSCERGVICVPAALRQHPMVREALLSVWHVLDRVKDSNGAGTLSVLLSVTDSASTAQACCRQQRTSMSMPK